MRLSSFNNIFRLFASDSEKRMLQLFLLSRMVMLGFFVSLYAGYFLGESLEIASEIRIIFFIVSFISLIQLVLIHLYSSTKLLAFFQIALDVILLTYAISITENISAFSLYLVLIISASVITNPVSALLIAALSAVCYSLLLSGILFQNEVIKSLTTFEILYYYAAFIGASLVSLYYAKGREKLINSIEEKSNEILNLNQKQIQLMNSMAEGVITLDLESAITGINDAAKAILGLNELKPDECIGKPISFALGSSVDCAAEIFSSLEEKKYYELKVKRGAEKESVLKLSAMDLSASGSSDSGKIIFLSDVSELKNIEERLDFHEKMTRLMSQVEDNYLNNESTSSFVSGKSQKMHEIFSLISRIAPSEAPVLLLGESGTGKELIAREIHNKSKRNKAPFIPVNCGAIPESLIESEFFGYVKGAFTGADKDSIGLFREANGGTLFLDEVGELPIHLQAKLLRVLQEMLVRPVGSSKEIPINVRIIAATNRNLNESVKSGEFRDDLFYRLKVLEIEIPPLRERKEDIPYLIAHFLTKEDLVTFESSSVSPEALSYLLNYNYPGNIRELENIIERGVVLGGGVILPENLPIEVLKNKKINEKTNSSISKSSNYSVNIDDSVDSIKFPINLDEILTNIEKQYINAALQKTNGAKKEAANLLNVNFRSFRYRLKKYEIDCDE